MSSKPLRAAVDGFGTLRQFASRRFSNTEHCELCNTVLRSEHAHLIEVSRRRLLCACEGCALLFSGRGDAKFELVPRRTSRLQDFQMTDAEWEGLLIPINLAFFVGRGSDLSVSAFYPSPAGATESLLQLETWNSIVLANPILHGLRPDVEALLVNRVGHARRASSAEYYIAPIDVCYRLVGLLRLHWRGLSGGEEVWREIGNFFAELRSRARAVCEDADA